MINDYSLSDKKRGKLIRYYRRKLGMTQTDLAQKVGVTVNTVSEWEKGRKPSVRHWYLLSAELGLPGELLDEDLSDPVSSAKVQLALLKQQKISPENLRTLEKAIALYFSEDGPEANAASGGSRSNRRA